MQDRGRWNEEDAAYKDIPRSSLLFRSGIITITRVNVERGKLKETWINATDGARLTALPTGVYSVISTGFFNRRYRYASVGTLLAMIALFIEYPWTMDDSGFVEELLYGALKLYWNIWKKLEWNFDKIRAIEARILGLKEEGLKNIYFSFYLIYMCMYIWNRRKRGHLISEVSYISVQF